MLNQDSRFCNCNPCPGAGCRCGCQPGVTAPTFAAPAACECGPDCGCEGAEQGCLCRPREA